MKLVADTNVLVSALLNPHGSPARVLDAILAGAHTLAIDDRILDEYREVLSRKKFKFTESDVNDLLEFIYHESEHVAARPLASPLSDITDQPFLEVALEAKADFLITGNIKDFPKGSKYLKIVTPLEFLNLAT